MSVTKLPIPKPYQELVSALDTISNDSFMLLMENDNNHRRIDSDITDGINDAVLTEFEDTFEETAGWTIVNLRKCHKWRNTRLYILCFKGKRHYFDNINCCGSEHNWKIKQL